MIPAILTIDGFPPFIGAAATEPSRFRFRADTQLSDAELNILHRARIEIDGHCESVLVESTDPHQFGTAAGSDLTRLHLTLRRQEKDQVEMPPERRMSQSSPYGQVTRSRRHLMHRAR